MIDTLIAAREVGDIDEERMEDLVHMVERDCTTMKEIYQTTADRIRTDMLAAAVQFETIFKVRIIWSNCKLINPVPGLNIEV